MTLQLIRDGQTILATDGLMYVDGRLNIANIKVEVVKRNERFAKNFPHKVATEFYICGERLTRRSNNYSI